MSRLIPAVLCVAVLASSAAADTVYLRNGRAITECTVIDETTTTVVIRVKTGILTFPRKSVDYIERAEAPVKFTDWKGHLATSKSVAPPPRAAKGAKAAGGGAAESSGGSASEDVDPMLKKAALEAIGELKSGESERIAAAKRRLTALGLGIAPVLVENVRHTSVDVRRSCADVLGRLGAKNAVKPLIEALYAATPETGRAEVWNRSYMRSVDGALEKITGRGSGYNPRSSQQQKDVQKWVDWWGEKWADFPRQVGEPEIDKKDEQYKEKLAEAKALKLEKAAFPEPKSFSDVKKGVRPNR